MAGRGREDPNNTDHIPRYQSVDKEKNLAPSKVHGEPGEKVRTVPGSALTGTNKVNNLLIIPSLTTAWQHRNEWRSALP